MQQELSAELLCSIANTYGTPLYVYNADKITAQFRNLQNAFANSNTRFFYACKSLTNINILKHILSIGCSIDCSSVNEAHLALHQ
jgi:diaminopimelate decarboxylase